MRSIVSFRDIKGQDKALLFLKRSIASDRVAHAYIFLGPRGVGKFSTALNFAKALNCLNGIDHEPCESCLSCKKIKSSNHPDLFSVKLEKDASSIKIDRIRELIKDIGLKPYEGRKKVYIIDSADCMTQESSNALLKTLEEPPSDSVLILIAENLGSLFQTIVSRSQVVRFFALKPEVVSQILVKDYSLEDEKAHVLAHLSSGRLGEALTYTEPKFFDKRSAVIDALANKTFFDSDLDGVPKEDLRLYLDIMLTWYRDILIAKTGSGDAVLINIDRKEAIYSEAKSLTREYLLSAINNIIQTSSFLDQNANQKLAMSVLGLNIGNH